MQPQQLYDPRRIPTQFNGRAHSFHHIDNGRQFGGYAHAHGPHLQYDNTSSYHNGHVVDNRPPSAPPAFYEIEFPTPAPTPVAHSDHSSSLPGNGTGHYHGQNVGTTDSQSMIRDGNGHQEERLHERGNPYARFMTNAGHHGHASQNDEYDEEPDEPDNGFDY